MFATEKQDDYFKLCCCEKKVSLPFAFLQPFVALGIVKKRATNKRIDLTTLVSIVFEPLCLGGNKARLIFELVIFFFFYFPSSRPNHLIRSEKKQQRQNYSFEADVQPRLPKIHSRLFLHMQMQPATILASSFIIFLFGLFALLCLSSI